MNALIVVAQRNIGDGAVQTVNARDLHAFLENGDHFATWMKERISQYGFVENQDFVTFSASTEKGRPRVEYAITLDMAKELAMVERNDKGKQARQYFIECERQAKSFDPMKALNDPVAMRGLLLTYSEKVLELEAANCELKPKAEALDRIAHADGSMCITDAAKNLQVRPKDLFGWLSGHQWIYRRQGGSGWLAYQGRIQAGLLEHKVTTVERSDGSEKVVEQVLVTAKGLARLAQEVATKPRLVA